MKSNSKIVSIIITTKNEELVIEELLESIKNQSYKKIEIILVDNNSKDKTKEISKKYTKRIYNFGPERSAQRNYGAKNSKGSYLLFLDADMKLSSEVVGACVNEIETTKGLVGIAIAEESIAYNFWGQVKAFERSFYNENGDPVTDAARFFKKEIFFKSGGYDESITGPEDWDLPDTIREMGYEIGRVGDKIYHREQMVSLSSIFYKKFYYGLKAHTYLKKHEIPVFSPKTIYFLRPLFYKNFDRLLAHPFLSIGLIIMLFTQLFGGGLGYLIGRYKTNE